MLKAGWKSLLARKRRLVMSVFAITLGVSFVAGSFIFTDTLARAFAGIFEGSVGDVVVRYPSESTFEGQTARTIPADVVTTLGTVEGAARVDGNVSYLAAFVLDKNGKLIGGQGAPALGLNYTDAPAAGGREMATLTRGRAPAAAGEVVLDESTAKRAGYLLGEEVPILVPVEPLQIRPTLVGIVNFEGGIVGASIAVFETTEAQRLFLDGADAFTDIWVTAAKGTSQEELRDAVAQVLPSDLEAVTGTTAAEEGKNSITQALSFINTFLLVFAAIALIVGAFLIVNTFSILVAQRSRELALFRAIGATRAQVTRSVVFEAFIVGLIGSTLGLVLGAGLAMFIRAVFTEIGLDLSGTPLAITYKPVVAAYVVGILFTVLAAFLPARRAGAVAPVAAMRDDAVIAESSMRRRVIVGVGMVVAGAVGMAAGLFISGVPKPLVFLGLGILGVLLGVALTSPVLGRPVLSLFGAIYARLFGAIGAMAKENALRNPRRTAATSSALMIGLTLVVMMSVFGASAKASIDKIVAESAVADFAVNSPTGQPYPASVTDRLASVPGVDHVLRIRGTLADVDGQREFVVGIEPEVFGPVIPITTTAGAFTDLDSTKVAVSTEVADVTLGDRVTVRYAGAEVVLTVAAVFESTPVLTGVSYVLDLATMDELGVEKADVAAYVTGDGTVPLPQLQRSLEEAVADVPLVAVNDQEGYADQVRAPIDQLLFIIYALLGLAVIVAVLGIVNTLALSVIERTREIGLLRAVGLSRRQLRRMIQLESVVIAILGAALGMGLGLAFGVAIQQALADDGIEVLRIPVTQLAVFVALAGVVGVLAAWWPGRQAARLNVLEAIASE